VINLEAARRAQALDIVRPGRLEEQKTRVAPIGFDLAEYRKQVCCGRYEFDSEELAETILDRLLLTSEW
jgi:hypothetical protein